MHNTINLMHVFDLDINKRIYSLLRCNELINEWMKAWLMSTYTVNEDKVATSRHVYLILKYSQTQSQYVKRNVC